MNAQAQQSGFLRSALLHGVVIALLLLGGYMASLNEKPPLRILELVAGEGNNFMATEAPALGTPGGVKLNLPAAPTPKPEPPAPAPVLAEPTPPAPTPAKPEPAPVTPTPPAPTKSAPTKTAPPPTRTPAQEIRRLMANANLRAKKAVAKERAEEQKRLTKEEFDRLNKANAAAAKSTPTKIQKIDTEGIAKGVTGGSTANKEGGAGGKALESNSGAAMERYESMLIAALRAALEQEKPPGLSESLISSVQFRLGSDGSLTAVRITKGSGSREFDDAVRAAFRRVNATLPPRPDGKSETLELDFRAKEDGE